MKLKAYLSFAGVATLLTFCLSVSVVGQGHGHGNAGGNRGGSSMGWRFRVHLQGLGLIAESEMRLQSFEW